MNNTEPMGAVDAINLGGADAASFLWRTTDPDRYAYLNTDVQ